MKGRKGQCIYKLAAAFTLINQTGQRYGLEHYADVVQVFDSQHVSCSDFDTDQIDSFLSENAQAPFQDKPGSVVPPQSAWTTQRFFWG